MSLVDILKSANRNTGDWLPEVDACGKRAYPCGNPYCADEAMRANGIRRSSSQAADQAEKHALKIAQECAESCPLNNLSGGRISFLMSLSRR